MLWMPGAGHIYGYGIYGKGLIILTNTGVFVMVQVFCYLLWVLRE